MVVQSEVVLAESTAEQDSVAFHEFVLNAVWAHGNRVALIDYQDPEYRRLTFRDVYTLSYSLATSLHKLGMQKGDRVSVIMRNCIEFSTIYLGSSLRGGVVTGVNPEYSAADLTSYFKDCGARFIFAHKDFLENVRVAVKSCAGQVKCVVCVGNETVELLAGETEYDEMLVFDRPDYSLPKVPINARTDVAYLPYSSGTTGRPKGVMIPHYGMVRQAAVVMEGGLGTRIFEILDMDIMTLVNTPCLGIAPYYHVMGFTQVMDHLRAGFVHLPVPRFIPRDVLRLIQDYKVMFFHGPAALINFLTKSPMTNDYDLTSIAWVVSGAAPWGKQAMQEFINKFPHVKVVSTGWGMSETTAAVTVTPVVPVQEQKLGSVGRVVPEFIVKVIDLGTGSELGPNQEGELCVKSRMLMSGYLNNEQKTRDILGSDGWLHTGDVGYYDNDNDFFITDRIKEMIKVKGFQVAPAELEDLLLSHSAVADAAVIGIRTPDQMEELPTAFIVPKQGLIGDQKLLKDIISFVTDRVVKYKRLTGGVKFVSEIPKSHTGKILRRMLRDTYGKAGSKL